MSDFSHQFPFLLRTFFFLYGSATSGEIVAPFSKLGKIGVELSSFTHETFDRIFWVLNLSFEDLNL